MSVETAYLCLGSNVGDREGTLGLARGVLARAGLTLRARSALYETPPWGPIPQGPYLNQVVEVESPVGAHSLLFLGLLVERMLGRDRSREVRFGPRRIDIDILLYGHQKVAEPDLEIPHPRLLERAFALVPLVEIAPGIVIDGVRAADALAKLDSGGILAVPG
ncbi:2-amino-4-hydroxy-6-hydroxymethyldihydropteridine diphosphokinase [Xanthobacter agilis]|jgi:2-amino-4-hydroxy-6-hydroxymethyldihydropteridine diphosphokinase|uniref:2-amino-4-hydroxy-6-hydroxymethyldihydropteridine pyrophosphokinase n=1 Tax=Xanthobacter agilis TaxID=47492 RepID=A0ABU0L9X3_XANAG|nr:2-amino-4-hydroxy-6-hydroxymethyldihydropteridine diphosphokinase [Xanthobacter agilis]MDQ0503937.1 2-amino-4-hydroxy-6-hydroxymethyldihydropteridine diphosphokinase [Xanthobacter agilis]